MPDFQGADWVSSRTANWSRWLECFVGLPRVRGLEIGTFEGRSALWFMENVLTHPSSRLLCVDAWCYQDEQTQLSGGTGPKTVDMEAVYGRFLKNAGPYMESGRLSFLRGASREELHKLPLAPAFEFVYVDGSHIASSTLEDSLMAWWRLRPGGVLIWDDYRWSSDARKWKRYLARPKAAIDAFLKIYDGRYDMLPGRGWQVAIQRR